MLFGNFQSFDIITQQSPPVKIHGIRSETGTSNLPPLLLLHGFPQTHHIWHAVATRLLGKYEIIALDLRGYGASSHLPDVASYAKSTMARDCVLVMRELGFDSFYICAHDRGARVAHKLCVDYPKQVKRAIFLDICPTLAMYGSTNFEFAKSYFHWFFLIQREPLPENMISENPRNFAEMFMGGRQDKGLDIFHPESFEHYVHNLGNQSIVHSMCQDYRASASLDLEEAQADIKNNRFIECPLTVLWGRHGVIERCFNALEEWRTVAKPGVPVEGYPIESGHYIPEHAPEEVVKTILSFFNE